MKRLINILFKANVKIKIKIYMKNFVLLTVTTYILLQCTILLVFKVASTIIFCKIGSQQIFHRLVVRKNVSNIHRKNPEVTCNFCNIFGSNLFTEHLLVTIFASWPPFIDNLSPRRKSVQLLVENKTATWGMKWL